MYDYVLVPSDGGPELRAVLTPAGDLAWRCGAKVVVVSTTPATDKASRLMLKSEAISQSSTDIDFWVDLDHDIGEALVLAARYRPNSIICAATRYKQGGLMRKRALVEVPRTVFTESAAPIFAIGPETDVSRGLPMGEIVMVHDASERSAVALATATEWAASLKLELVIVGLLAPAASTEEREWLVERLEAELAGVAGAVRAASLEIVESTDPVATMAAFLTEHREAVFVVAPDAGGSETAAPGSFAAGLLRVTPQALLFPARIGVGQG
ncbi:MAG: hypothetical protein MUE36_13490 [Acidimicrobiales bacterium]|jgi:hypothetical protein|nr:hypothetical protein [Acidimicrobiales bacterium]